MTLAVKDIKPAKIIKKTDITPTDIDYRAGILLGNSNGVNYTVPADGIVVFDCGDSGNGITFHINATQFARTESRVSSFTIWCIVKTNDTVRTNSGYPNYGIYFYPFR
jgi:hypothetical protein